MLAGWEGVGLMEEHNSGIAGSSPLKRGCGRAPVLGGGYSGFFLKTLVHISLAEGELQPKEGNSVSDLVSMARG